MSTRGTVSIVSPSFHPMIGGIESYLLGVGGELVKSGFEVHLFTPDSVMKRRLAPKEEIVRGISVHRIRVLFDLSYRLRVWPGLLSSLDEYDSDLIHVYSHDLYAPFAALAARRERVPLLMTTYGPFQSHSAYGAASSFLFSAYDSLVTPRLFRSCDLVFVRYPELCGWVSSLGVERERIVLEPSGIPSEYLVPARKGGSPAARGPVILYLGRVSAQKGVQYAVMAMRKIRERHRDALLNIVGPDYIGYTEYLRSLASRCGVEENVVFSGAVTDPGLEASAVASSDVLVMPSSFEGFSQAVMKGMAQGKPCVVTAVGGLPYEVDYGRCGLLCRFGDPRSLADGVLSLLESPELAGRLSASARERAGRFTFESIASTLSAKYEEAVRRHA
ncbi:MAG: glycosyltransferase family 4 protein [Nitrososphaerota archaeon]|nr:glycosyltransferase family 4 protein [Nitrososphaerota archaeon]MDG6952501.1 glycosyltransferase family 4 protein [Nitrososphaerota archaeon]